MAPKPNCWLKILMIGLSPLVVAASDPKLDGLSTRPLTPLDLPVLDLPFNVAGHGYSFPSMAQSLSISKDFYQSAHRALMATAGSKKKWVGSLAIAGFDVVSNFIPFGNAWIHEEWHRAALSRRNISSYNDVYHFPLFKNAIAVSHVSDAELVRLKRDYPAEHVRLQAAGWEAEYELNQRLEKESFFFKEPGFHLPLRVLNYLGPSGYLFLCASDAANSGTDELNREDGGDIPKRDFTGLDCTGWAYDLFRPNEPYEARGTHPSGVGINRYRKHSDLSREEQNYLTLQSWLSLLNFINPSLYYLKPLNGNNPISGNPIEWNATARHMLTSFGSTTDLNIFWKEQETNLLFIYHNYFNQHQYYPGIEAELLKFNLDAIHHGDWLSARLALWLQPKAQRFDALAATPGALASLQYGYALSRDWDIYAQVEAKSEGWVAGNAYLDKQLSVRVGAVAYLF